MSGYTKLFASIVSSTVWREDDKTRIVWITMLAMRDRFHVVEASIPGLADFAKVSLQDCEQALEKLSSPDPYSRTEDFEGRRIEKIDGGWRIINGEKYRQKLSRDARREANRIYKQRSRARQKLVSSQQSDSDISALSPQAEAEEEDKKPLKSFLSSSPKQRSTPPKPKLPAPIYDKLPPKRTPTDQEFTVAQQIARKETEALKAKLRSP